MALTDTDKILGQIYFDPGHVAGFKGKNKLKNVVKHKVKSLDVSKWLQATDSYTLHRSVKRRFPRQKFLTSGRNYQWQADLADMTQLSKWNDNVRYLLCVIDTFSRKLYIRPVLTKNGQDVARQFQNILNATDSKVHELITDRGKEFYNTQFNHVLKLNNIKHFSTFSQEIKAGMIERAIKTIKSQICRFITHSNHQRYVDKLDDFVHSYNSSVHSALGMSPYEAQQPEHSEELWQKQYTPDPPITQSKKNSALIKGDRVRLSKYATTFHRGFLPNWSDEIFVITEVRQTIPITYIVEDENGEQIQGTFYKEELQRVLIKDNVYKIEKVIGQKKVNGKIKLLVRWKGYGPEFDSYIDKKDLIHDYKN